MSPILTEFTVEQYDEAERQYELRETIEDIMESVPQARQRSSFYGLVMLHSDFPDLGVYNEILILYPAAGRIGEVCADNMLVRGDHHDPQTDQRGSFRVALEAGTIFLVAEYVSESNPNKDRPGGESFLKYERDLKVAYYLLFDQYDHNQPLRLFHHNGEQYELVPTNSEGRFPIAELFLEAAVIGNMVRYWYRGELLPVYEEIPEIIWDKNGVIADQQDLLEDKDERIAEQEGQIAEQERRIAEQEELTRRLREAMAALVQMNRSDLLPELAAMETLEELERFMARLPAEPS